MENPGKLIPATTVARWLDVGKQTVRDWIDRGYIVGVRIPDRKYGRYFVTREVGEALRRGEYKFNHTCHRPDGEAGA